ncbi:PaaX family transcriptional regulator C-terminal domain-containing protein [Streptomyces sp. VRA16 Mangrove soil]|uniref:PaaX family transcriptional regulator n=1 Tax=Streptomyces sp. VRA16 Mangrove soil TaxID=2817434 RepID=UPI001A9EE8F4|nr:PaaX family transcriptional regulator C-terminal domain-containing protein [Streptomyces sp. VRA16 Mangrove soil]MBO1329943.1 PaaX family transcriptional regulator [Streptomyces sp. VRA16 Mangrove soil]
MLSFLGDEVLGRGECVYTGSVIEVFRHAGVGEQATRSTLTRMVDRGLLRRQREGRRVYVGLTDRSEAILRDGERRIWKAGAVNRDWDGTWTLLGFSLPESWQRKRHDLRSQLTWAGFGALFGGLWIAPGHVDVSGIVAELGLAAHVKVFRAHADAGMDIGEMIDDAWDLAELAARYRDFVTSWQPYAAKGAEPSAENGLALRLRLTAQWLQVIRTDPRLPVAHLPSGWPAAEAEETFRAVHGRLEAPAREAARRLIETIPA